MPGRNFYNNVKLNKAYCEGRAASKNGLSTSDNPFVTYDDEGIQIGSHDQVTMDAWDAGYASWTAEPKKVGGDCDICADLYGGGYVPPET